MNILLCSLGSHGDIHPYLALGRELLARGHAVTFATSACYRDLVGRHGLGFAPVRPDSPIHDAAKMARIMDARRGPQEIICKHVMPNLRNTYEDLRDPVAWADVVVSHVLTHAVPVMAEHLRKPWASTVLSPMVFFSAHDVPVLAPAPFLAKLKPLGPGFNRALIGLMKWVSRSWSQPVRELRRDLGLPPGADPLWEGQHSPHLVLAMFGSRFGPPQPDWPPNVHVTGFPFLDSPDEPLEAELERFLAEGEPPIVFTLGSAAVQAAGPFYAIAARVAKSMGRRAVLVAGPQAAARQGHRSSEMAVVAWASYSALFGRAKAVVHQGGVGTTAQALRAGVPQLVIPFAHDQFDNAERVRRLGCGRILRRGRLSDRSLQGELEALLGSADYATAARKEAQLMQGDRGAAGAAEALLKWLLEQSRSKHRR